MNKQQQHHDQHNHRSTLLPQLWHITHRGQLLFAASGCRILCGWCSLFSQGDGLTYASCWPWWSARAGSGSRAGAVACAWWGTRSSPWVWPPRCGASQCPARSFATWAGRPARPACSGKPARSQHVRGGWRAKGVGGGRQNNALDEPQQQGSKCFIVSPPHNQTYHASERQQRSTQRS